MPLKFCANISLLFTELPFLERFSAARRAGFSAVEIQFPYDFSVEELLSAKNEAQLGVVLINVAAGDLMDGGEGLAAVPERKQQFRDAVAQCVDFAKTLDVSRVNVLPGRCIDESRNAEYLACFHDNLCYAASVFEPLGITTTFEAINTMDMPGSLISSTQQQLDVYRHIDRAGVALQYDIYHMARMQQPIEQQLRQHMATIGHIQFADCPGRHEPGTGELDLVELFSIIEDSDYSGWVGAEYQPSVITEDTLYWL